MRTTRKPTYRAGVQAQVGRNNIPAFQHGWQHKQMSVMEAMCNTTVPEDPDNSIYHLYMQLLSCGFTPVERHEHLMTHFKAFLSNPIEYVV